MEENKKYKLTDETIEVEGKTLYRIESLKDFRYVLKGEKGGFVESEDNLSQEGNCWIADDAMVYDDARVSGCAEVVQNAIVCGRSKVENNAVVYGYAFVKDSYIIDDAVVGDYATVTSGVSVGGGSNIRGNVEIKNDIEVHNGTCLGGNTNIHHQDDFITFQLWWKGNKTITYVFNKDKWFTLEDEYSTDYLIDYVEGDNIQALIEMAQIASKFNGLIDIDSFLDKIEAKYVKKEILPDGKLWLKYKDIDLQLVLEFDKTYQYRENDIKALNDALKAIFSENNIAEIKRLSFIKRTEISLWKED